LGARRASAPISGKPRAESPRRK